VAHRFNSDPNVIGRTIRLNRHELTVVGVATARLPWQQSGLAFDAWVPLMMNPQLNGVGDWMLPRPQDSPGLALAR